MRHAYWSQTVSEVSVHIPVKYIQKALKTINGHSHDFKVKCKSSYKLDFKVKSCEIQVNIPGNDNDNHKLSLCLAYDISSDESTWYTSRVDCVDYVVLVLFKATPITIFAGCEWWDRVFEEDEKIDTLTCSVGADTSQLPPHAHARAEKEHARFQALSAYEQQQELDAIKTYKEVGSKGCMT
jgi:hypothetical protein